MATGNSTNTNSQGIVYYNGTGTFTGISGSKVTTYDSSDTWTKSTTPPSVYIEVIGFNGGCGGGSGRKGTSTASGGGQGGQGGGGFYFMGPASVFDTSETVTIGGTSNGGVTQSTDAMNGNAGSGNNATTFGNMTGAVVATGGAGGTTTTTGSGGLITTIILPFALTNVNRGVSGSNLSGSNATFGVGQYFSGASGGGGAGYDLVTPRSGGNGAAITKFDGTTVIVAGGSGGSEAGTINGSQGNIPATIGGILSGGSGGGGGGGPSAGTTVGNGGDGGIPGGGGGGGSGGIATISSSGTGGNGVRGRVIVIEHF